jgi:Ion channel
MTPKRTSARLVPFGTERRFPVLGCRLYDDLKRGDGFRAYYKDCANLLHVGAAALWVLLALIALVLSQNRWYAEAPMVAKAAVALVDLHLLALIVLAALRSDNLSEASRYLPQKLPGLLAFVGFVFVVVSSFAVMYRSDDVQTSATPVVTCSPNGTCVVTQQSKLLCSMHDAVYFSVVTLATVGYGDYVPVGRDARFHVEWQIATGVLMLIVGFPLLLSRIANW